MANATLDKFLAEINTLLRQKDNTKLRDYLVIEPPFAQIYTTLIGEVRSSFPKGSEDGLENRVSNALPTARDGIDGSASWTAFVKFMVQYLVFLRDVDVNNLLETYNLLSELLQ